MYKNSYKKLPIIKSARLNTFQNLWSVIVLTDYYFQIQYN
jgi:hypothetical protein